MIRLGRLAARAALAGTVACAAASLGVMVTGVLPKVMIGVPPSGWPPQPTTPFIGFAIYFAMLLGVPAFAFAGARGGFGLRAYLAYGVGAPALVLVFAVLAFVPAEAFPSARGYDIAWIVLTELLPGGVVAGFVAYLVAEVGEDYLARFTAWIDRLSARSG